MFQDIILAENRGTFHDTPSNKMKTSWGLTFKTSLDDDVKHRQLCSHNSAALPFKPTCLSLCGKTRIFPVSTCGLIGGNVAYQQSTQVVVLNGLTKKLSKEDFFDNILSNIICY